MTTTFSSLGPLSADTLRNLTAMGIDEPTPIQKQTIPVLLTESTDFVGLAGTGTGKTAAFGVPLVEKVDTQKRILQGLVICPTRELCVQVREHLFRLSMGRNMKVVAVYGGAGYRDQMYQLQQGAHIVVATPGRLIDFLDQKILKLDKVKTVILDEADEMISMGFQEDLERILDYTSAGERNIWLFSATMSREIFGVAKKYLNHPKQVEIINKTVLNEKVEQRFLLMKESQKIKALLDLIDHATEFYGIVFCQTRRTVDQVTEELNNAGCPADYIHGDKNQRQRERTLMMFKRKQLQVIVCTDVAARGIDINNLTHVVNYSLPAETELYVHRIGRTARAGRSGFAVTFLTKAQLPNLKQLERLTKSKLRFEEYDLGVAKQVKEEKAIVKSYENDADIQEVRRTVSKHVAKTIGGALQDDSRRFDNRSDNRSTSRPVRRPVRRDERRDDRRPSSSFSRGPRREDSGRADDRRDDRRPSIRSEFNADFAGARSSEQRPQRPTQQRPQRRNESRRDDFRQDDFRPSDTRSERPRRGVSRPVSRSAAPSEDSRKGGGDSRPTRSGPKASSGGKSVRTSFKGKQVGSRYF